jgi:indole-3-glycerol phosphate synthase
MATYLDRILAAHRARAESDQRDTDLLAREAKACGPTRGFAPAIRSSNGVAVIAEVKRASPSKGPLSPDLDPSATAAAYERGGAAALSVLTDAEFFAGSAADLIEARAATALPVLRKDFTVGPRDVYDARRMGADAVLLIVAALSQPELVDLTGLVVSLGMDALVEVHDEEEAERALGAGATLIGVNQRDLVTFQVDATRAERVAKVIPDSATRVAESGIENADDVRRLMEAGFDAVLVGEALVTSTDIERTVMALRLDSRDHRG